MDKINLVIREGINLIDVTLEKSMNDENRMCVYKEDVLVTAIDLNKFDIELITDNIYRVIEIEKGL